MTLPDLKTGDSVLITHRRYGEASIHGPHQIERETKTLFIVAGRRFRKRDHQEQGIRDVWSGIPEIIPADSEEARKLIRRARIRKAKGDFLESVNRSAGIIAELETALKSRELLDKYIELLKDADDG